MEQDNAALEELRNAVRKIVGKQEKGGSLCPRCGVRYLREEVAHNALSRVIDIYICPDCGTEEALTNLLRISPLTQLAGWSAIKDIKKWVQ